MMVMMVMTIVMMTLVMMMVMMMRHTSSIVYRHDPELALVRSGVCCIVTATPLHLFPLEAFGICLRAVAVQHYGRHR